MHPLEEAMSSMDSYLASSADLPVLIDIRAGAGTVRIVVSGDLERASSLPLEQAVTHVLRERRPGHLELDLAGVMYIDTGGIRSLLRCRAAARPLGCRLTVTDVQPFVYRVLEIVGLLEPFGLARRPLDLGDHVRGDVAQLPVAVLGDPGEEAEGLVGSAPLLGHDDALGLLDDGTAGHRLP